MADPIEPGHPEVRHYGVLLAEIARRTMLASAAYPPAEQLVGKKRATFYHSGTGYFESATEVLLDFGLSKPISEPGRDDWYCIQELTVDCADIPGRVAASVRPDDPRLGKVVSAYIGLHYYAGQLSSERAPFSAEPEDREAMEALSALGYLERAGSNYSWTDLAGSAWQRWSRWNDRLQSWDTIERGWEITEARAALDKMPPNIRAHFFDADGRLFDTYGKGVANLAMVLAACWRDGEWLEADKTRGMNVSLAKRIAEITGSEDPAA